MTEREKVIKGLETCEMSGTKDDCVGYGCPYIVYNDEVSDDCQEHLFSDALALLKAQEPVEPTIGRCEEYDGHDSWWYQCGKCQKPIDYDDKYCRTCGQAVKWE